MVNIKLKCPNCPSINSMILMANNKVKCPSCLKKFDMEVKIKDPLDEIFVDSHKRK